MPEKTEAKTNPEDADDDSDDEDADADPCALSCCFFIIEEVIGCELLRLVSTSTTPTYVRDRSLLEWQDPIPTRATGHSDPVPQQRLAS